MVTKKATRKPAKRATKKATKTKARCSTKCSSKKTTKKAATKTTRKGPSKNSAFMRPVQPDDTLALVVGATAVPRTQIVKKLWNYIKKNNLQDAKNRRNINADAKLKKVFNGKSTVNMFEMTKLVSRHLK